MHPGYWLMQPIKRRSQGLSWYDIQVVSLEMVKWNSTVYSVPTHNDKEPTIGPSVDYQAIWCPLGMFRIIQSRCEINLIVVFQSSFVRNGRHCKIFSTNSPLVLRYIPYCRPRLWLTERIHHFPHYLRSSKLPLYFVDHSKFFNNKNCRWLSFFQSFHDSWCFLFFMILSGKAVFITYKPAGNTAQPRWKNSSFFTVSWIIACALITFTGSLASKRLDWLSCYSTTPLLQSIHCIIEIFYL